MTSLLPQRKIPFRFLSMFLPVVAIGLLGYTGNIMLRAFASPEAGVEQPAPSPSLKLPAAAVMECCRLQVNAVTRPEPDASRVTLNITLTNMTTDILQISPGLQLTIKDTAGIIHNYTADYLPAGATSGGPLQPYSSRTENLDFELPPAAAIQSVTWQQDAGQKPLTVELH